MSDELKTAIEASKIGAEKALLYFNNNTDLGSKNKLDNTLVTIADPITETAIKEYITSVNPDAKILGEETGGSTENESFWIIDPIDGTKVYARGINAWAVLISYFSKGEFVIGVCNFPMLNESYYAEKGKGAYLNGKKINVSNIKPLSKSLINSGNPKNFKSKQIILNLMDKSAVNRGYETTYADCLVAAGKMDASIDPYAQLWDFAPFATLIPEAGGKITNLNGTKLQLTDRGCMMSNGLIHQEIADIMDI